MVAEFPREVRDPRVVRSPVSGYEALDVTIRSERPYDLGAFASRIHGATHDPARARAILDSAGWRVGARGNRERRGRRLALTMIVGFPNPEIHRPMPELLQAQLRRVGIEFGVEALEALDLHLVRDRTPLVFLEASDGLRAR